MYDMIEERAYADMPDALFQKVHPNSSLLRVTQLMDVSDLAGDVAQYDPKARRSANPTRCIFARQDFTRRLVTPFEKYELTFTRS